MDPPPPRRPSVPSSTSSSSVQYVGKYDPLSTVDAHRRARSRGNFVDLVTRSSMSTVGERERGMQPKKKRVRKEEDRFSMPGGKRQRLVQTTNIANYSITLEQRWNQGAFRWVHKGKYTQDPRIPWDTAGAQDGQPCVQKEFKTGSVYEDSFFSKDILAVDKAASIIRQFNSYVSQKRSVWHANGWSGAKTIYLNRPAVWEEVYPDHTGKNKKKLVEPMLEGEFLKFNSNSGYTNGAEFMQALSRFSYHITDGMFLLCDLQGGHYDDCYILTDPVIMSWDNRKMYGSGDLGREGIENFFAYSTVNKFCDPGWKQPKQIRVSKRIPKAESTSLSLTLGTLESEQERKQKLVDQFNQQWGIGR